MGHKKESPTTGEKGKPVNREVVAISKKNL